MLYVSALEYQHQTLKYTTYVERKQACIWMFRNLWAIGYYVFLCSTTAQSV